MRIAAWKPHKLDSASHPRIASSWPRWPGNKKGITTCIEYCSIPAGQRACRLALAEPSSGSDDASKYYVQALAPKYVQALAPKYVHRRLHTHIRVFYSLLCTINSRLSPLNSQLGSSHCTLDGRHAKTKGARRWKKSRRPCNEHAGGGNTEAQKKPEASSRLHARMAWQSLNTRR